MTEQAEKRTSPVAPATEGKLREAMRRLLTGTATKTEGRLTKANLHVEAGSARHHEPGNADHRRMGRRRHRRGAPRG
ncbi:hypothetical protein [Hoyosella subflava]|uniref:Uncharacterized protein n=1 Tax=Hoyosella subflava (strain DSM 45089 / JCM 17490 / NBRC 109087 / DQS3-9A1) TaxID=443218 RepID=F6ESM0_HOYSD|nr:hypothetical protein [Hoyosella subflava]AEF43141.1 hypothetical protein AS9A_P20097 [Hoyosella subflava DQS3-9A1]